MDSYGEKPKKLSRIPAHVSRLPLGINLLKPTGYVMHQPV
jgi:hypothetical protein